MPGGAVIFPDSTISDIPRLIEESGKSLRLAQGWIRMAA
jgi:hypothetical protein